MPDEHTSLRKGSTISNSATTPPTIDLRLVRPEGMEDTSWAAITTITERLGRALDAYDLAQVVGGAKELVESVAKSVLLMRGTVVTSNAKYPSTIAQAREALGRQPGPSLSRAKSLLMAMENAKKLAIHLGELRNTFGTGHGRAQDPEVNEEVAQVCTEAALLWVRWALRRFQVAAKGMPTELIKDLDTGTIFYKRDLAERIMLADLPHQEPGVQRRVGVAVAHRAMRDTVMAMIEGLEACADATDTAAWPEGYRKSAFEALFISPHEQLVVSPSTAKWAAGLIAPLPDAQTMIEAPTAKVEGFTTGEILFSPNYKHETIEIMRDSGKRLSNSAQPTWIRLIEVLAGILLPA